MSDDGKRKLYTGIAIAAGVVAVASGVALVLINRKEKERRKEAELLAAQQAEKKKKKKADAKSASRKKQQMSASVPTTRQASNPASGAPASKPAAAPAAAARPTAAVAVPPTQSPGPKAEAKAKSAAKTATTAAKPASATTAVPAAKPAAVESSIPVVLPTAAVPAALSEEAKRELELAEAYDLGRPIPAAGTDAKETPSDNLTRRRLAFQHYTKAFELGNNGACFKLAQIHMFGFAATPINEKRAYEVLKRGADAGAKHCRAFLAWAYLTGSCGLKKNPAVAVQLLEQAQKDDPTDVYARVYYAHLLLGADDITGPEVHTPVKKDVVAAGYMFSKLMPELEALTNGGDLVAQVLLAELLTLGDQAGVARDAKRAAALWEQAADFGHAEAQYMLSVMYQGPQPDAKEPPLFGEDHGKAFHWAERSATQGFTRAQCDLALMLMEGLGCTPDLKRALQVLDLAAANGSKEAHLSLGNYWVQNQEAGEEGLKKAFQEYQKAADGGLAAGLRALGMCYAEGIGVERNPEKALQNLMKAAQLGDKEAIEMLTTQGPIDESDMSAAGAGAPLDDESMMRLMMLAGAGPAPAPGAGAGAAAGAGAVSPDRARMSAPAQRGREHKSADPADDAA